PCSFSSGRVASGMPPLPSSKGEGNRRERLPNERHCGRTSATHSAAKTAYREHPTDLIIGGAAPMAPVPRFGLALTLPLDTTPTPRSRCHRTSGELACGTCCAGDTTKDAPLSP